MTDIKIITENKDEIKPNIESDIKQTLKDADDYQKLKEENDRFEAELLRKENLKARINLGGKAQAGQVEKSPEEKTKEEAEKILNLFK